MIERPLRVLLVTSEWPTPEHPEWAPFIAQQVRFLMDEGIDVDVFSFRGSRSPWRYLVAWFRLRKNFHLRSYDLIHAHYGQSGLVALPAPVPVILTFHGSDLQGIVNRQGQYILAGRILQWISRIVASRANRIIVVAERLKRYLPGNLCVHVIPGGLDLNLFYPTSRQQARQTLGLPMDQPLVLFPARPDDPVKHFSLAKAAVELLQPKMAVRLVTLGGIPHDRVANYINACDVLLLTSFHEGSPTVVKEALACNLPVVSVDVGDVRERLANLPGCVLCEEHTPQALAESLLRVLENPVRYPSRSSVLALDEALIVRQVISVYEDALNG